MKMKKVVLITGCSSGIGFGLALRCAESTTVIATVRNQKSYDKLLNQSLQLELNIDIQFCDVTKKEDVQKLVNYVEKTYECLDCVINNAGIALGGFFEDCTMKQVEDVIEVNVLGLMRVTKAMLPMLHKSDHAKIINVSSIAGRLSSWAF